LTALHIIFWHNIVIHNQTISLLIIFLWCHIQEASIVNQ
jgi:hypothetical protein